MAEPPFGDNPAPPPPPAPAPKKALLPARPEVTREDLEALVESKFVIKSRRGDGQMEALCPAHEDSRPSLGVKIVPGDDGGYKVIVDCRRNCERKDVLAAVGLTFADLFTYDPKAKKGKGKGRVVAEYPYTDEKGVPLFAVVRFEPKDFRQHALNPDGSTPEGPWSIKGIRRVLFRLPRVLEAVELKRTVWVVEGEKDVLRLEALGLYATCNMGGAASGPNDKKWLAEYADQLAGAAEVIVVPDNDEPGRRHAETIAASLKGRVGSVTTLDLARFWPECPHKGDASNFLDAHPGIDGAAKLAEFAAAAKQPVELVKAEPVDALPVKAEQKMKVVGADWRDKSLPWPDQMVVTARGAMASIPYNAALLLEQHELYQGRIRYDEFANRVRFKPPTWWLAPIVDRLWGETDTTFFRMWADKGVKDGTEPIHFGKDTVNEAVLAVGMLNRCHPLREWLDSLVWDGKERLPYWLEHFCGAEAGRYSAVVGTAWMISAVARIFEPGCQADHILVLRGEQGIRKTSLFRTLGGPYYGSMEGVKLDDKDAKQKLQGKWILEFAELDAIRKYDVSTIKAYITETVDHFRLPYGRDFVEFPRQCVFGGTINQGEFLKDETGNRRFWIVECHAASIDTDRVAAVRDQLFAEAVARYKRGEKWWLTGEDEKLAAAVQFENLESGLFDDLVRDWLESDSRQPGSMLAEAKDVRGRLVLRLDTVMQYALRREPGGWNRNDKVEAAKAMYRAGWTLKQYRTEHGGRAKGWMKRSEAEQPELEAEKANDDALPY